MYVLESTCVYSVQDWLTYAQTYQCKDGRFFYLHGSVRPSLTLKLLELDPDLPFNEEEARKLIAATCVKHTAEELRQLYESHGLVSDILLKLEEWDASEQARSLASELLRFDLTETIGQNRQRASSIAIRTSGRLGFFAIQPSTTGDVDLQAS